MSGRENMRCHFVPQSYIKRFKDSQAGSQLFTLNVSSGPDCKVITKSPENVAQIYNWYISKDLQNRYNLDCDQIENDYGKLFESDLPSALDDLEGGKMKIAAKKTIARFIAYTLHRVPISREYYRNAPKKKDELLSISEDDTLIKLGELVLMHISTVLSGDDLFKYLMTSEWWLVKNKGVLPFISSDNPVVMQGHPGTSSKSILTTGKVSELQARATGYCVTLSPKNILYINTGLVKDKKSVSVVPGSWDDAKTKQYNDIVLKQALSTVYSNKKDILDNYQKEIISGAITNDEFVDNPWQVDKKPD